MDRILLLPDIRPSGYPANPKAGYRISGKGRIPDIRPDTWLGRQLYFLKNIKYNFINSFNKYQYRPLQT
jgi:hypothetical protein